MKNNVPVKIPEDNIEENSAKDEGLEVKNTEKRIVLSAQNVNHKENFKNGNKKRTF